MKRWFSGKKGVYLQGKCEDWLKKLPAASIDAIVTDPPYGLSFMGKKWDYDVPTVEQWREVLRVLKPGGHVLSFGGTRTYHRMVINIEDAGFEIRDQIQWIYGSGFPKGMNIQQAINKAERGCPQGTSDPQSPNHGKYKGGCSEDNLKGQGFGAGAGAYMKEQGVKVSDNEGPHKGWGTALKPANEPICLARKPLGEKTVAANVLKYGTGGMNIDGCRVEDRGDVDPRTFGGSWKTDKAANNVYEGGYAGIDQTVSVSGRFPANVIHDGSEEVLACFPNAKGQQGDIRGTEPSRTGGEGANCYGKYGQRTAFAKRQEDSSSAARFFYCAKASKKDRGNGNTHPTVKPQALISYLIKLILPPGGIVVDPWAGSGTLAKVCEEEEIRWCCIEKEEKHCDIAKERVLGC